ncbi:MAG: metallophosphoesterase [Clostridia bacterium]|nr:metallophosphoesterase [Clostridia bacterium]
MIYATSDLHGYPLEKFGALLEKAEFSEKDFCFVLGDVIDRGTEGIKTLRWLMAQPNFELVLGNHESMMLACDFICEDITDESIAKLTGAKLGIYSSWISNGGGETLKELYALSPEERRDVFDFLRDAPLYETVTAGGRDFILTHSGLGSFHKDKKLSEYIPHDLIWTRPSLGTRYFDDITTVFGHSPTLLYGSKYEGKAIFTDTWINIDTGAACGLSPMLLRLDDLKEFYTD